MIVYVSEYVFACVLHAFFNSLDRGMQKHDSLGVETICLTCNQFVQCQGVYIKAACHKEEKNRSGQDFINQFSVQSPRVYMVSG